MSRCVHIHNCNRRYCITILSFCIVVRVYAISSMNLCRISQIYFRQTSALLIYSSHTLGNHNRPHTSLDNAYVHIYTFNATDLYRRIISSGSCGWLLTVDSLTLKNLCNEQRVYYTRGLYTSRKKIFLTPTLNTVAKI